MGSHFSHSRSTFDMEAETKIARFYKVHPMYYDLSHVDYSFGPGWYDQPGQHTFLPSLCIDMQRLCPLFSPLISLTFFPGPAHTDPHPPRRQAGPQKSRGWTLQSTPSSTTLRETLRGGKWRMTPALWARTSHTPGPPSTWRLRPKLLSFMRPIRCSTTCHMWTTRTGPSGTQFSRNLLTPLARDGTVSIIPNLSQRHKVRS